MLKESPLNIGSCGIAASSVVTDPAFLKTKENFFFQINYRLIRSFKNRSEWFSVVMPQRLPIVTSYMTTVLYLKQDIEMGTTHLTSLQSFCGFHPFLNIHLFGGI